MHTSRSLAVSAAVAAIVTHGMVFSAVNLNDALSAPGYQRFFQAIVLATERLWSYAHGWPPMSHIRDFGQFYAPLIHLICPLIGFGLFRILSRHKVGTDVWKPLTLVLLLTVPSKFLTLAAPSAVPWLEAARTMVIVWAMVWSVGALSSIRGVRQSNSPWWRSRPTPIRPRGLASL